MFLPHLRPYFKEDDASETKKALGPLHLRPRKEQCFDSRLDWDIGFQWTYKIYDETGKLMAVWYSDPKTFHKLHPLESHYDHEVQYGDLAAFYRGSTDEMVFKIPAGWEVIRRTRSVQPLFEGVGNLIEGAGNLIGKGVKLGSRLHDALVDYELQVWHALNIASNKAQENIQKLPSAPRWLQAAPQIVEQGVIGSVQTGVVLAGLALGTVVSDGFDATVKRPPATDRSREDEWTHEY